MKSKPICINVDFDGTCVTHDFPDVGRSIGAESVLQELIDAGHKLILFTMRSGIGLDDAVMWFEDRGLPLYGVQTNPTQSTWTTSPKSYAPIMIDDSALGCPLKPPNKYVSHRPYVDWGEVRRLLVERGLLAPLELCVEFSGDSNLSLAFFGMDAIGGFVKHKTKDLWRAAYHVPWAERPLDPSSDDEMWLGEFDSIPAAKAAVVARHERGCSDE